MKNYKQKVILSTILSGIFGVWGTLYVSRKVFMNIFIKMLIISLLLVAVNYVINYFTKNYSIIAIISIIELTVLRTMTIFWSLFISKGKNSSETELTKQQEIELGNSGINFGLSNIIFIILIPIFCGCYFYAILTWAKIFSENVKIIMMVFTIFTTLIIGIYFIGKEDEKLL